MQKEIIRNIKNIKERIDIACSMANVESKSLTLIAVSKKKSHELIKAAIETGGYDFYVADLLRGTISTKKFDKSRSA